MTGCGGNGNGAREYEVTREGVLIAAGLRTAARTGGEVYNRVK